MSAEHVSLTDTSEYAGELLHILMPTRGSVAIETMLGFSFGWATSNYEELGVKSITFSTVVRAPVADAREMLLSLLQQKMEPFPQCQHWALWVDDDANPDIADIMGLLNEMRRNPDLALLSCWYSPKIDNHTGWIPKFSDTNQDRNTKNMKVAGVDFKVGSVVEVPWTGLHCAVMRGNLVNQLERPAVLSNMDGVGEDVFLTTKLRNLKMQNGENYKCAVHTGVRVAHIDTSTGKKYFPVIGAARE